MTKGKKTKTPLDERILVSVPWQLTFGFRDDVDLVYEEYPSPRQPRLPHDTDRSSPWRDIALPDTVDELLGNTAATSLLHGIQDGSQSTKTNFVISGEKGSGKQSFLRLLKKSVTDACAATEHTCVFQTFNARLFPDREIVTKMEEGAKKLDNDKTTMTYFIIEHFEIIPIAIQQHHVLPLIAVCNTKNIFGILIVHPDASKVPDQLKQRAGLVHMTPLKGMDVRTKLLQICGHHKVGYHREAMEELLQLCRFDLLACIAKLQQVFVSYHFVSVANVQKSMMTMHRHSISSKTTSTSMPPTPPPFPLSIVAMNEPLRRCKLCTLLPPCSHITIQNMYDRVERIRQFYTTREDESPPREVCPSYVERGICANIQSIGRCRYAHPRGIHTIDTSSLTKRCALHTLPLPCLHCNHIQQSKHELREEEMAVATIQKELVRTKKLLLDKETDRYMFVRESTKSVKWGAARREYEAQLGQLETKIQSMQLLVNELQENLQERLERIQHLSEDVTRGRSRGLGRGHGKNWDTIQSA